MNMRIKLLIVFASMLTLIFAVNLGVASAHEPPATAKDNAWRPIASHIIDPGPDAGSANGATHGFNWDFEGTATPNGTPDPTNPAVIGITHNPLCPLHPTD